MYVYVCICTHVYLCHSIPYEMLIWLGTHAHVFDTTRCM